MSGGGVGFFVPFEDLTLSGAVGSSGWSGSRTFSYMRCCCSTRLKRNRLLAHGSKKKVAAPLAAFRPRSASSTVMPAPHSAKAETTFFH